ncbi:hypothetical protein HYPSUDRAFT_43408 [Hypholoma sublateritium FD-334 SS-4]|uniref:Uncharacterized protein n=1 Tax=Hypholoma sublateritium (strain FD-334 SS-4) TaxID=945553 RepID=A0A0D2NN69_HYPSF|nr:hypothetical protein HYPSUDRAFT_43408 [Hypholoma sublateritium FD-334 SS-4]
MPKSQTDDILKAFIKHQPKQEYTFESDRGSSKSELCRDGGRECIDLQMDAKHLFQAMQDQGFFCALPIEPGRTYMKCRPLPE